MEPSSFSKWQILLLVVLFWTIASQAQMPDHERPEDYPKKEILEGVKGAVIVKPEDKALKLDTSQEEKKNSKAKSNKKKKEKTQE